MGDKVQLRDHRYPCEHGHLMAHIHMIPSPDSYTALVEKACPGGRELTATEMDWCNTHGMHWMHWPDDAIYCIAHHIDHDEAERIGKCVRSTILIVRQQHDD